ncbi:MAG: YjbQ family protein [Desulfobacterales bacterium]|jgi:secondary thiamine-phosphate synthase enzyme|nr:YjbQ family protein [Desulfobacteraceae bacterium]MBT7085424.1 YjbQ family protein [Desulfobacterales bacterium]
MTTLTIKTGARTDLIDITSQINDQIYKSGIKEGVCFIYVPHTTAGVTINESADPDVKTDIKTILDKIIPWDDNYKHNEGNSSAHMKTTLVGSSEHVPIENGSLFLGTWQGVFFCEFDGPRTRKIHINFL